MAPRLGGRRDEVMSKLRGGYVRRCFECYGAKRKSADVVYAALR